MHNLDILLIKGVMIDGHYSKYRKYLDDLFQDHKHIYHKFFRYLDFLYEKNEFPESLEVSFYANYPFFKDEEKEIYALLFKSLAEVQEVPDFVDLLERFKERAVALELAREAIKLSEGSGSLEILQGLSKTLTDGFVAEEENLETEFISDNVEELLNVTRGGEGLNWRLRCLQRSLGPLRVGDFGFVFARPETGKTTFLASEVSGFIDQITPENPILWFNNEERGAKVKLRIIQAYFGVELSRLTESQFRDQWRAKSGRLLLRDSAAINKREVESLVRNHNPSLIIFDQIDKVKGFSDDRNDLELGQIYIWARELAKEFAPVIGVCQAGGTAENKMWLTMDDVVNAKTSKQAEADWIMGIGALHDSDNLRYLHLSKNKLMGGPKSVEEERHGKHQVLMLPMIARYEDL